ncbi:MAG TPA: hypothetical protein VL100_08715, partial [Croceibacterium sp.]|nr:hypothetical protein [Croceibacterium sp.]
MVHERLERLGNFLLPQGKAVRANAANLAAFEQRRAEYEAKADTAL